jgi:hypothetical protein
MHGIPFQKSTQTRPYLEIFFYYNVSFKIWGSRLDPEAMGIYTKDLASYPPLALEWICDLLNAEEDYLKMHLGFMGFRWLQIACIIQ